MKFSAHHEFIPSIHTSIRVLQKKKESSVCNRFKGGFFAIELQIQKFEKKLISNTEPSASFVIKSEHDANIW